MVPFGDIGIVIISFPGFLFVFIYLAATMMEAPVAAQSSAKITVLPLKSF